jgi:hypothetical protein
MGLDAGAGRGESMASDVIQTDEIEAGLKSWSVPEGHKV